MRKKIIGFTFLFSIIMLGLVYYYNNVNFEVYNLENETMSLSSTEQTQVSYKVNHIFPNLDGTNEINTETFTGNVGDVVTVIPKTIVGFSYDSKNVSNILSGTLEKDSELVLNVYYVRNKFTVYLKNSTPTYGDLVYEDGTQVPSNVKISFGESIYLDGNVLVVGENRIIAKPVSSTVEYEYSFNGWDLSKLPSLDSNGKFTIVDELKPAFEISLSFERNVRDYKVSWMNEGKLIYSEILKYGETPVFSQAEPTKAKDPQYTYKFNGWSPEVKTVTGDAVYNAQYSSTINNYKVYFEIIDKNLNYGTLSISGNGFEVPYGTKITINKDEPNKISIGSTSIIAQSTSNNAQYEYSFELWQYDTDTVTSDVTIYAKFKRIEKTYTVLWMSEGTVLEIDNNQMYGTMPEFNGKTPSKPSNDQYSYKFTGWSPKISVVTKNVNYYAQFEVKVKTYTVSWKVNNVITEVDENVPYGTMP